MFKAGDSVGRQIRKRIDRVLDKEVEFKLGQDSHYIRIGEHERGNPDLSTKGPKEDLTYEHRDD